MNQDAVNILLVDDQPAKLLSYEVILSELGETLIKSGSAREALEVLLKTDVAVILLDVSMPELDGFELATMIREHPRFKQTAIIFVSAIQVTEIDSLRGYQAGAVDYVPVPVVPEVLRAKVRVFAELYRKTRQLERLNAELERRVRERTAALEGVASQLQQLNDELEQRVEERTRERESALAQLFEARKLETIGQLTGGVAHDFNNLLMAVLGSLELLKKRLPPDDERSHRLLGNATQGAERGAALTQRLLAFARRQELKPETVDIGALVGGMEDLLARALGPAVIVNTDLEPQLPPVRVDANQLELAILNLAVNARDAMPGGGSLVIRGREDHVAGTDPDKARNLPPGPYVRLDVVDCGDGMDAATLARATEPFFTTKGPGKGTGLGLSMVQGLAMQSGGSMVVSSEEGVGTTIAIWLPRAEWTGREVATSSDEPSSGYVETSNSELTVLVVDDDLLVCAGTAAMVEDLGHHAVEAYSGPQALEAIRRNSSSIDVVITDYAMPGMTGLDLARQIRDLYPSLPVIMASGYAEVDEGSTPITLPKLAKPFRQSELASILQAALDDGATLPSQELARAAAAPEPTLPA